MSELPPGWATTKLGAVAETRLGKMLSKKAKVGTEPRPYLSNKSVQWGRIDIHDLPTMDFGPDELERFGVVSGDLLVCEGGEVGRAAIWRGQLDWIGYQKAIHRVRPFAGIVPDLLLYCFKWLTQSNALDIHVTGSTITHLPQEGLRQIAIPLPPLNEQRRIVAAIEEQFSRLDAADASLVSAARRALVLRREALTLAMTEGEERVVGDLLDGIEAGRSFRCYGRRADPDEWGVIKVSAMTWGAFDEGENKAVLSSGLVDPRWEIHRGDLLLSRANTTEYVGATVLVGECRPRLLLSDKSMRLLVRPTVAKEWLRLALSSPSARAQMSAGATGTSDSMRNISQAKVKAVRMRVPPLGEQRRIVALLGEQLSAVDALRAAVARAQRRSAALRRAVLERAFRGELVRQDPSDEPASILLKRLRAEREASPVRPLRRRVGA